MSEKIIIYQVLTRLVGKFDDFQSEKLKYIKDLGCTHVWYTGILEHATQISCLDNGCTSDPEEIVKGFAGSPYAIKDYYDIAHYLAVDHNLRITEFEQMVARTHKCGLKVIIDFIPNHVSRIYSSDQNRGGYKDFGLEDDTTRPFSIDNDFYYIVNEAFQSPVKSKNSTYYEYPAKATGNNIFTSNPDKSDWYDTVKLNYGIDYFDNERRYFNPPPLLWDKMLDILIYWIEKGVDGFRCDMADMVPVEFWNYAIQKIKSIYPNILFIAESYKPENYRALIDSGFNLLYDKVGLYETVINIIKGYAQPSDITCCWQKLGPLQDYMLNFIENHDEQRVASDFIAGKGERGIPALTVGLMLNRSGYMIYFAQELGERGMDEEGFSKVDGKTTIYDFWELESISNYKKGIYNVHLKNKYNFLLNIAQQEDAISKGELYDLQYANIDSELYDSKSLFSFARKFNNELILIIVNFSDSEKELSLTIPSHLFTHWGIGDNQPVLLTDLWSGDSDNVEFSSKNRLSIIVEANMFRMFKLIIR